jgi:hypothetical protein
VLDSIGVREERFLLRAQSWIEPLIQVHRTVACHLSSVHREKGPLAFPDARTNVYPLVHFHMYTKEHIFVFGFCSTHALASIETQIELPGWRDFVHKEAI